MKEYEIPRHTYRLICHNCQHYFWSDKVQPACIRCRRPPQSATSFIITCLCIVAALWLLLR